MRNLLVMLIALVATFGAGRAFAETFAVRCDDGQRITIATSGSNSLTASPIDGGSLRFRSSRNDPEYFTHGEYGLRFGRRGQRVEFEIPDYGTVHCRIAQGGGRDRRAGGDTFGDPGDRLSDRRDDRRGRDGDRPRHRAGALPHPAQSWGGSVRAAPDVDSRKIASLREGEPITILEQADAPFFQDLPWFRIRFDGRTGYQWGGIICPIDEPVEGTFEVCH
ncbi:SH3 domain-containing protein [Aurantimonas sp. VKM B-3413]|uniref:SH3 domain-containing protein n=1 Tax=Aurantimonas sp. VKM B-3413 TaxID=2779401 RepID=UPI001E52FAB8|nr:SH3 domain-containing protein [Aurantimonas sp. VKM B-3413]MCB8837826.1 SH3 domain-containing protein [Aurantimonas sp. VKM B-3413]